MARYLVIVRMVKLVKLVVLIMTVMMLRVVFMKLMKKGSPFKGEGEDGKNGTVAGPGNLALFID